MTRIERRLLVRNSLLGTLLTLVVLLADWNGSDGMLSRFENIIYDLRARHLQLHTGAPTNQLIHLNIDDNSLQYVGRWPWRYELHAKLVDEMRMAGLKSVAYDVLFGEPDRIESRIKRVLAPVEGGAEGEMGWKEVVEQVDGNADFAAALKRFGSAILPASYEPRRPGTALQQECYKVLLTDVLMPDAQVREAVVAAGFPTHDDPEFRSAAALARKQALFDQMLRVLDKRLTPAAAGGKPAVPTEREMSSLLFPDDELRMEAQLPPGVFTQQYTRAVSFRSLRRFARDIPPDLPAFMPTTPDLPPITVLSDAVTATSFVNYLADGDGIVRVVAMWCECEGLIYPQFGLMLACQYMGVDIRDIEIHKDHMIIPKPDGTRLRVPTFSQYVDPVRRVCGTFIAIPWFGPSGENDAWTRIYDYPQHVETKQQLPMLKLWEPINLQEKIDKNISLMHSAIGMIFGTFSYFPPERFAAFDKMQLADDDAATRLKLAGEILDDPKAMADIAQVLGDWYKLPDAEFEKKLAELLAGIDDPKGRHDTEALYRSVRSLPDLRAETPRMIQRQAEIRSALRNQLNGKAAIVGYAAVGRMDVVPTSMMPIAPGPIVHGVVFNAFLTGDVWTRASPWITRLFTLLVGLLATAAVAYFSPFNALLCSLGVGAGYLAFNGFYLFDYQNTLVGAAAPIAAIGLVWSGCTLLRFIVERAERRHIEKRFRSYVDPALVNAIVEHPERVHFEGESREMSVVFTDLAGFTTLSEKLKARTVPILNEYMRRMVNIIRDVADTKKPDNRRGYRNKFLGDGIMFFFGAPLDNQLHAIDAVGTVLRMQEAMPAFNDWLKEQDLPSVKMRAGISTGEMIVGDAGSPDAADYTVLGDDVNLGARLESANKATGTLVMVSQRTRELCGDRFLFRPLAKLQVVGKEQSILVYEPICEKNKADTRQELAVQMTEIMLNQFIARDFAGCIEQTRLIDEAFGASKLTAMYRRECENYMAEPPGANFDGTIVLAEK